jgi:hypothetical protein
MKRALSFTLVLASAILLMGCGQKFEPTESTIFVTSKGVVKSAIMESFDKSYYDFDELYKSVEKEVKVYCLDNIEETVTLTSLTEENDSVTLLMDYQTVEDYANFNEVLLFSGTFAQAVAEGYLPDTLHDVEGITAEIDLEKQGDLKVLVTEESVCIQTSGRIKFVSDNVTVLDKKLAKAMEAGKTHPAFVLYK